MNLFYASGNPKPTADWRSLYLEGAGNEVYEVPLSHSFEGLTFTQAVKICYDKLNLMLIGINDGTCHLNPSGPDIHIHEGTFRYFIGTDFQIASIYCSKCHDMVTNRRQVCSCSCNMNNVIGNSSVSLQYIRMSTSMSDHDDTHSEQFYTSSPQQPSILSDQKVLHNHIVLCVFALDHSAKLGLHSFVAPLRSKSIPSLELKPIVIVSSPSFIEKE